MAGQLLHVAQAAAGFRHQPGRVGDERAPARVRRAAVEAEIAIELTEPVHDAAGSKAAWRATALRPNYGTFGSGAAAKLQQGAPQVGVERYRPTIALFGGAIVQLDVIGEPPLGVEHHRPGQLGDLAGAETGFDRQQDHDAVALRVTAVTNAAQDRKS